MAGFELARTRERLWGTTAVVELIIEARFAILALQDAGSSFVNVRHLVRVPCEARQSVAQDK